MKRSGSGTQFLFLVLLGSAAYFALNYYVGTRQFSQFASTSAYERLVIWIAAYVFFFILFMALIVLARGWTLWIILGIACVSFLTNVLYNSIVGFRVDQDVVEWLVDQRASLSNAYAEFFGKFLACGAFVFLAFAVLVGVRAGLLRLVKRRMTDAMVRKGLVVVAAVFLVTHLIVYHVRPLMLPAEVNVPLLAVIDFLSPPPNPAQPQNAPVVQTAVRKVVLVVDESIRADYFEHFLADSLDGLPHLDYGEAAVTVPCSAGSNALLRWGINAKEVLSEGYDPRRSIYIWSYAKRAGYRTVLINGQASGGTPQNFLGRKERRLIDEEVAVDPSEPLDIDVDIAKELTRRFSSPAKEFIYVVKRGVHFPYQRSYPPGLVPDDAPRITRYEAALVYSTGRFFRVLRSMTDYAHIFLVYTSDHGQVFEEGKPTHCRPDTVWEQYSVPLVVFTGDEALREKLSAGLAAVRDHASHEQIFPTLLWAMGYAPDTSGSAPVQYATPLYARWPKYTVLLPPFVPGQDAHFEVFSHFPYRNRREGHPMPLSGGGHGLPEKE
jgi:hypothetical protein